MTFNFEYNSSYEYDSLMPYIMERGFNCVYHIKLQYKKMGELLRLFSGQKDIDHPYIEYKLWYHNNNYYVLNTKYGDLYICALSDENLSAEIKWLTGVFSIVDSHDRKISYYQYSQGVDQYFTFIDLRKKIYTELYPSVDIDQLFNAFAESESKILILTGAPGTGKTSFIKYALAHDNFDRVAYAKDSKILQASNFWYDIISDKHDLLILDDLDVNLGERNDFVSNMLSHIDGVFSSSLKVIITTNQPIKKIDEALLRPGRCFDIIDLRSLTRDEAREIWVNTLKADAIAFDSVFVAEGDEVTQASLMDEYQKYKMSTRKRSYLKDTNDVNPVKGFGFNLGRKSNG